MKPKSASKGKKVEAYKNPKLPVEKRVEDLVRRMTLEEKIAQLSGATNMETRVNERLGIPALKMCDGPHGVRTDRATCFPTAICWGASWDPELMQRIGVALAHETRAKDRNMLLGPCVNIHRTPLGGRNFESFAEDPYLAARMAVAYVKGVQSEQIVTSTKHFACNNQEWERMTIDTMVDERTLHEIYLPAFKAAIQEAGTWTIMAAYNRVNGPYCCANKPLLTNVLKNELGFRGLVVSDWGAVHGTVDSAHGGLDLEMPGPGQYFGAALHEAVRKGEVSEMLIDDKVRRILRVIFLAGLFDGSEQKGRKAINTKEHQKLVREAGAAGMILLKNRNHALPLDLKRTESIAVIGPNATVARTGGGGSSTVHPFYAVSPLDGILARCGKKVAVRCSPGCINMLDIEPIPSEYLVPPKALKGEHGLYAEYFNNMDLSGSPVVTRFDEDINFNWGDGSPDQRINCDYFSARWTGKLMPPASGTYRIGMTSDDGFRLYLDGKLIVDSWVDQAGVTKTTAVEFEAGRSYDIRAEYFEKTGGALAKLGWILPGNPFEDALRAARESDVAIVFAGISYHFEGEGTDRNTIELPEGQNELILAIAEANPNTIVVLNNGTPLIMTRWLDKVAAVIEAWYPGQENGNSVADLLFGDVNPSGKLPVSFPKRIEDSPSFGNYPGFNGKVHYNEGLYVGYRHFDARNVEPQFPFGFGLSYTEFQYRDLEITETGTGEAFALEVSFKVKNTGSCDGAEVAQLYVSDVLSSVDRPAKELKGFKKVFLKRGEEKTVTLRLGCDALSFYDPTQKRWVAEAGDFEILVGSSSRDIRLKGLHMFLV